MPEHGYIRFTGDYAQLKKMGFTFQKLYANNYMQWCKDGFRVWKKGHDITWDEFDLYSIIKFMDEGNLAEKDGYIKFFKFYNKEENEYTMEPMNEANWKIYKENMDQRLALPNDTPKEECPPYIGTQYIHLKTLETFRELCQCGWVEIVDKE